MTPPSRMTGLRWLSANEARPFWLNRVDMTRYGAVLGYFEEGMLRGVLAFGSSLELRSG